MLSTNEYLSLRDSYTFQLLNQYLWYLYLVNSNYYSKENDWNWKILKMFEKKSHVLQYDIFWSIFLI